MPRKKKAPKKKHLLPKAYDGQAEAGVSISPMDLMETAGTDHHKAAPVPGIPMSERQYQLLKKKAEGKIIPEPGKTSKT